MAKGRDAPPNRAEPEPVVRLEETDRIIPCLKCRQLFPSVDHVRNRLCPKCERENSRERGARVISMRTFNEAAAAVYDVKVI